MFNAAQLTDQTNPGSLTTQYIRNIIEFERDYPDARIVLLKQNYRSTQNILDAAIDITYDCRQDRNVCENCRKRAQEKTNTSARAPVPVRSVDMADEGSARRLLAERVLPAVLRLAVDTPVPVGLGFLDHQPAQVKIVAGNIKIDSDSAERSVGMVHHRMVS